MVKKIIIACTLVCMTTMVSSVSLAKTIDRGQRGHHVSKVQTMLKHQGFLHDSVDGIYGHNTEQAVRKFQKSKGLAVDGRVGPTTMNALEKMETRYGGHGTELSHNGVPNKYSRVLEFHHALIVCVCLIQLHQCELRVMTGVNTLIAEYTADLVYTLKSADDQSL